MFDTTEMGNIRASLMELNDWAGEEIIRFKAYRLADNSAGLNS